MKKRLSKNFKKLSLLGNLVKINAVETEWKIDRRFFMAKLRKYTKFANSFFNTPMTFLKAYFLTFCMYSHDYYFVKIIRQWRFKICIYASKYATVSKLLNNGTLYSHRFQVCFAKKDTLETICPKDCWKMEHLPGW